MKPSPQSSASIPEGAPASDQAPEIETELSRDLGLVSALAIGVGTMIAAGIFTLSGLAVGYVGSAAIAAFLVAAVVALFTALTYCEFSSIYPQSGEGYLYARRTFPAPLAYTVGWCLVLGYTSSCGFYVASLSTYFNEFLWHSPIHSLPGVVAVVALTLLNLKGTKESGSFQVLATGGKIILLIWFIAGGIVHVESAVIVERFSHDVAKIGSTAAMVFITFFGFSAIAASAGEVRDPTRNIPRAIFISMGLVTVLYTFVVLVIVAADLSEYSESAMGTAAQAFLGPVGGKVIVAGALFSMTSAANASILAGSRVVLSMAQLGHLPKKVGSVHPRTKTPFVALLLVGTAIAVFSVILPLEDLAHFADCVLLIALILVNAALIQHRRKFPHLKRPFRVPLVPLLPAFGIIANFYLLLQMPHLGPVLMAAGAIATGFVGYVLWKSTGADVETRPGESSRVALEQSDADPSRYRVLVPVANPETVDALIDLAAALAKPHDGHIIALRVIVIPDQLPPDGERARVQAERQLLNRAHQRAQLRGVPMTSLVRIGHDAARAVIETASDRHTEVIVLGWKGHSSTARRILGQITDEIVNNAPADIVLVKLVGTALPRNILLPTTGGIHAQQAEDYAAALAVAQEGEITLCSVVPVDPAEELLQSEEIRLAATQARIVAATGIEKITHKMVRNHAVSDGIIEELANHDGVVVGAASQSLSKQILFGSIPELVAKNSEKTVIVVKHYRPVRALFRRMMNE